MDDFHSLLLIYYNEIKTLSFKVFHCVHFECPSMDNITNQPSTSVVTSKSSKRNRSNSGSNVQSTVQPTETATEAEEIPNDPTENNE